MTKTPPSNRREIALEILRQLDADAPDDVSAVLDAISPDLFDIVFGFTCTDVLARPGIDLKTREMLTVAALTAMGNAPDQLGFHIRAAMKLGVSREEIVEIMLQMAVYGGVPAFMKGMAVAIKFLDAGDQGAAPA